MSDGNSNNGVGFSKGSSNIATALKDYEQTLRTRSKLTQRSYTTSLNSLFVPWLANELNLPDGQTAFAASTYDLPPDSLEKYYLWLIQDNEYYLKVGEEKISRSAVTHRSAQAYLAAAKNFFQFLDRRELLAPTVNYLKMVDGLKQVLPRNANSYDTPQVDRKGLPKLVVAAIEEPVPEVSSDLNKKASSEVHRLEILRDKAVILTLWATGMRRAEVASLNRTQVADGRQGEAIIKGKGRKERVVWFDEMTLEAIAAYLKARGDSYQPLFIRHDRARGEPGAAGKNYRLSAIAIWNIVKRYAAKAGVPTAKTHDFRHAKATNMLNRGAKLEEVQDVLGHASPVTTKQIYAHYTKSHLAEANRRYSVSVSELLENEEKPLTDSQA